MTTAENDRDVHTEHCCLEHGCKYGDDHCTVTTRKKRQSYPCEWCPHNAIKEMEPLLRARADDVASRSSDTIYWKTIIYEIILAAASYWADSDLTDFCVQNVSDDCIVFGGVNRLIWRPAMGYFPDRSYCNEAFLRRCDTLGRTPGRYHRDQGSY